MARQDQTVEGGTAYQAQGNLTVTHGMDADGMAAVMVAMAKHLQVHFAEAEAKLEERLTDFRKAVLEEFAKPENEKATEAFKDPDFQFVLNDAQKVYVRDGTAQLRDDLVRLLLERSQHDSRDRTAKVLNQAIEIAGSLSKSEYAALAVNFLFLHTQLSSGTAAQLLDYISSMLSPFIKDLSDNVTVYEYLESQRCATVNHVISRPLPNVLSQRYTSGLSEGFDPTELHSLDAKISFGNFSDLLVTTGNTRKPVRFKAQHVDELARALEAKGMTGGGIIKARELYARSVPGEDKVRDIFSNSITGWNHLSHVWEDTSLSKMTLTAVGKAIAHSALISKTPFDAPLAIWVS